MKTSVAALVSFLTLLAIFAAFHQDQKPETSFILQDDECTDKMKAECAVDIERTAKNCAKAFATEGAGIISDIKCLKDLKADRAKCWPCLC